MRLFCKHDWKVLSEKEMESVLEIALKSFYENGIEVKTIPHQLCHGERKYIAICSCNKCGKIKKFVETSN